MNLSNDEHNIVRRLADGEDPWAIDPVNGCTNPLTGYFPSAEVAAEKERRALERALDTWSCHVCGAVRPDEFIAVFSLAVDLGWWTVTYNVRFCADRATCAEGAPVVARRWAARVAYADERLL